MWVQLALGDFSIETVAQQVGVDRRTVRRRLARHGTTYSALLDEVRRDMAPRHLDNYEPP